MEHARLARRSVEYNLTEHCNLRCYACDHASPLLPRKFADVDEFERDMCALAEVFHAQEIRLVGGEPLLHPRIVDFLRRARGSGIADAVVVYTNGTLLQRMNVEFWDNLDDLRVSVYPGVHLPIGLEALAVICEERGIRLEADAKYGQFQQTLLNCRNDDRRLVEEIFRRCEMPRTISCHTVYEGRFYLCSVAPFQRPRLAKLGIAFENQEQDSVAIHGNPRLCQELERMLRADRPLAACEYCLGTSAPWTPHRQLDSNGLAAWLAEDHGQLIEVIRRDTNQRSV